MKKQIIISVISALIISILIYFLFSWEIIDFSFLKAQNPYISVPEIRNESKQKAEFILLNLGLNLVVEEEKETSAFPYGAVLNQNPLPGVIVRRGSTIETVISKGIETVILPDVRGLSKEEAVETIEKLGLKLKKVTEIYSDRADKGNVVSQTPLSGTKLKKGEEVEIVISKGSQLVVVPYLIRKKVPTAQRLLEKRGLRLGRISQTTNVEYNFGIILSQSPRAGVKVKKGTSINVVVNTEAEEE